MTQIADHREIHRSNVSRFREQLPNARPWLDELHRAAAARFEAVGYPDTKQEEWRFTNVAPIAKTPFELAQAPKDLKKVEAAAQFSFGKDATCELVFVNGHYAPELSKIGKPPRGLTIRSLAEAIADDDERVRGALGKHADVQNNPFVAMSSS